MTCASVLMLAKQHPLPEGEVSLACGADGFGSQLEVTGGLGLLRKLGRGPLP